MKTLFIEARKKVKLNLSNADLRKLPKKIGLLTSVQYIHLLPQIKKFIEKNNKKAYVSRGNIAKYGGQVLGCDVYAAKKLIKKVNAFLFIGSSPFHVLQISLLGKPVFTFGPENNVLRKVEEKEISKLKILKKTALMKFLGADRVGIIVSIKPGQEQLKEAIIIKKKLEKNGKEALIFICDNITRGELSNFDCGAWLNMACPALHMEPDILNISDYRKV